jgi:hypothetical protein
MPIKTKRWNDPLEPTTVSACSSAAAARAGVRKEDETWQE